MHLLQRKTYLYFWATAVISVLIGYKLFTFRNKFLSINIHDSYFVISNIEINILIAYALAFNGLIYYIHTLFKIPLYKWLTIIHTLITLGCVILYFLSPLFQTGSKKEFPLFEDERTLDYFIVIIGGVFLVNQLILIANSLISSIKCISHKKKL